MSPTERPGPPITRRALLRLPALMAVLPAVEASARQPYRFSHDYIVGTSLDLAVWTADRSSASRAHEAVVREIARLVGILDTRDATSEIRRVLRADRHEPSRALRDVLDAYEQWNRRTDGLLSIHPAGPGTPINVDALGKAYIVDRALAAARESSAAVQGVMVNIGGDIAVCGEAHDIGIVDPVAPYDNAEPIAHIVLHNAAIATSGVYARGEHLLDPRTGLPGSPVLSASVVASDAVTANALATSVCVGGTERGLALVTRTPGAEALVIERDGVERRTSGFAQVERPAVVRTSRATNWPAAFQVTLSLTLTRASGAAQMARGTVLRPYVAVWVENAARDIVKVLAVWATEPRYFTELPVFFTRAKRNSDWVSSLARATRSPGRYDLLWDGRDERGNPVAPGSYRITVEVNRENGGYGKQSATIVCGDTPATVTLPATVNFEPVTISYGPRPLPA